MKEYIKFFKFILSIVMFGLLFTLPFSIPLVVFSSYMEAKTYTKLTGVKVTTWDALWVHLRVDSGPGTNEEPK